MTPIFSDGEMMHTLGMLMQQSDQRKSTIKTYALALAAISLGVENPQQVAEKALQQHKQEGLEVDE